MMIQVIGRERITTLVGEFPLRILFAWGLGLIMALTTSQARASSLEVFHADSLAGPMEALKTAFEGSYHGVTISLTSGRSQELAERILKGERCDVFAPSSPTVIEQDLMNKKIAGSSTAAASWFVVFSANEMVVITTKGNPLGIRRIADLARPGMKFVRVTGEKDLATNRTIDFLRTGAALEGTPEVVQRIIDGAVGDPSKPNTVPDTIRAVVEGKADAGVVYYSAAVAAKKDLDIIRFPASVNQSDKIRNAATVPEGAENKKSAIDFIMLLLSADGRKILEETGQPALVPAIRRGAVPSELR